MGAEGWPRDTQDGALPPASGLSSGKLCLQGSREDAELKRGAGQMGSRLYETSTPADLHHLPTPNPVPRDGRTTRAMSCVRQQQVWGSPEQDAGTPPGSRGCMALPPAAYLSCGTAGSAVS